MALGLGGYFAVNGDILGFGSTSDQLATSSGAPEQPASNSSATSESSQQKAAEEEAQRLAQQNAAAAAAQRQAQQRVADEAAQRQAEQNAAAAAAQRQAQQRAADEAVQRQAQQRAADEAAQRQAQQNAAAAAAQRQAQQRAADEAAQRLAQQNAAEAAAQRQAQQRAAEEATQRQPQQQAAQTPQLPPDQADSSQIVEAQRLLTSMGLNTGVANGKMGPRTQEMVRAFQWTVGMPPTGELTMALLETLRGKAPPVAARAKSLFTLAAEARNARRLGDATRLYEAALKLAPNDADGLLALGDLRRDANELEAARRAYETLASGHGAAAGIARERLASLPVQQPPSNAQSTDDAASRAAHSLSELQQALRSGDTSAQINPGGERDRVPVVGTPTHLDPTRPFDGTYTGVRQISGFSNPGCRPTLPTTITVRDGRLSYLKEIATTISPDGSFSEYGAVAGIVPPITQHLTGRIQNGTIEADISDQNCRYHMSLKKNG